MNNGGNIGDESFWILEKLKFIVIDIIFEYVHVNKYVYQHSEFIILVSR